MGKRLVINAAAEREEGLKFKSVLGVFFWNSAAYMSAALRAATCIAPCSFPAPTTGTHYNHCCWQTPDRPV